MILFADTNILLDLYKVNLLEDFFRIKEEICIEEAIFTEELIWPKEIQMLLLRLGLNCIQMSDEEFLLARQVYEANAKLSFYDCVAFAVTKQRGWELLTGDKRLRKYAEKNGVKVHGLLWTMKECSQHRVSSIKLFKASLIARNDSKIRLPESELKKIHIRFLLQLYFEKKKKYRRKDFYICIGKERFSIESITAS